MSFLSRSRAEADLLRFRPCRWEISMTYGPVDGRLRGKFLHSREMLAKFYCGTEHPSTGATSRTPGRRRDKA